MISILFILLIDMPKLSILIPVYNEKGTLLEILSKIERVNLSNWEKEIIIIDDFSTDGTRELLKSLESKYQIIFHDKNYGKGWALRSGLQEATGDWIIIQDADLEYDPEDYKKMIAKTQNPQVSVVYGSRRLHHHYFNDRHSGHIFAVGGIFLTWLTNLLYKTTITDEPTCYKMFRTELLRILNLQCQRFEFCPEVTAKIAKKGIKIYEVPINYYPRNKDEGKKINWKDGLEAIWVLLKNKF